jgi:hypothetical protein
MKNFKDEVANDTDAQIQIQSLDASGFSIKLLDDRLIISKAGDSASCFNKSQIYAFAKKGGDHRNKSKSAADDPPQPKTNTFSEARIAEREAMLNHMRVGTSGRPEINPRMQSYH